MLLLNRFRVRKAQQFLNTDAKTITEIAFDLGFDSSQYFSKVFRRLTGITPSHYRQVRGNLALYDQRFRRALARIQR